MKEPISIESGTLYLVGTPIGTISDLSERAKDTLCGVDLIYAEDTRHSARICEYAEAHAPMQSYHEHNKKQMGPRIVEKLREGRSVALVTDAGMPAISDPGEDLVHLCAENDISVTCVPGPCAAITALALSGLSTARFVFEGFLPTEQKLLTQRLESLRAEERTIIFYEAPHRLLATLQALAVFFDDRKISVCRELTKRNEEILRTTLWQAVEHFTKQEPKGEFVLVMAGRDPSVAKNEAGWQQMTLVEHVEYYMESGLSKKDAMKMVARDRGIGKSDVYKAMLG